MKTFENVLLGKELKTQTDITKKQYKKLKKKNQHLKIIIIQI